MHTLPAPRTHPQLITGGFLRLQTGGWIRAVTEIKDPQATPTPSNYRTSGTGYLDDPYEGELMTDFVYLFGNAPNAVAPPLTAADLNQLWLNKRAKLQAARLTTPSSGDIVVQRGWWFSAHEQWKYLMLPYHLSDINYRVFVNGERARSWNSALKKVPGMFASVTNVTVNSNGVGPWQYLSACGVQEVAFETVTDTNVVTPCVPHLRQPSAPVLHDITDLHAVSCALLQLFHVSHAAGGIQRFCSRGVARDGAGVVPDDDTGSPGAVPVRLNRGFDDIGHQR